MLLLEQRNQSPCSALPALWQCKGSLTPQKNPICHVRSTNPVGKAEPCAPLAWLRPTAGPGGACAAPRNIPSWFWGHTAVALGCLCSSGCITSVRALGTLLSQAAHEQELPALPSTGHLSHSLCLSSAVPRPCPTVPPLLRGTRRGCQRTPARAVTRHAGRNAKVVIFSAEMWSAMAQELTCDQDNPTGRRSSP